MDQPSLVRASYLLDGRRVVVRDLLERGLLNVGDRLRFRRPLKGSEHYATVTAEGHITLDDGQVFRSPSKAAAVATGAKALDGWTAWVVESAGVTLDVLRGRLLDDLVMLPGTEPSDEEDVGEAAPLPRYEFLKHARDSADKGDAVLTTVRSLLQHWGGQARGSRIVERVAADLDNHGLTTVPDFRHVTLDAVVAITSVEVQAEDPDEIVEEESPAPLDRSEIGLTLGNLPSALGGVVSVQRESTLNQAVTLMLLHDFSQLPVMAGKRDLAGVVSWKSIAQARHARGDAGLADATVPTQAVPFDTELVDALDRLAREDFVVVLDHTRAISGIVTTADVVGLYGELATPFFLVGELDQELRRLIAMQIPLDEVRALCDPKGERDLTSHDDLTMGDYERTLQNTDVWARLGWPIDRKVFTERLAELRRVRNDITHYNPDADLTG